MLAKVECLGIVHAVDLKTPILLPRGPAGHSEVAFPLGDSNIGNPSRLL